MFVSSYNTYIGTNANEKINKPNFDSQKTQNKSFANSLQSSSILVAYDSKNIPINYISNYKSFYNKQKLQDNQEKTKDELEFKKISDFKNAKISYENNSNLFSFMRVPKSSINQTPKINQVNILNVRHTMVNTYLANDKYYQISA